MKKHLAAELRYMAIVRYGKFQTSSGKNTKRYIDMPKAYGYVDKLNMFADYIWDIVPTESVLEYMKEHGKITGVVSEGHGGIPLASILASRHGLTLTIVRKEPKDHGKVPIDGYHAMEPDKEIEVRRIDEYIDGYLPHSRDRLILVDGVTTTGGTFEHMIDILNPRKAKILGCYSLIARDEARELEEISGIPFNYIVDAEELF